MVTGSEFSYVPVSARDYWDTLLGFGVPAEEVDSEFVREAAASGVWKA